MIAVNDAWRMNPWADALYACDNKWWSQHEGCPLFGGEKWSSHDPRDEDSPNWKLPSQKHPNFWPEGMAARYGLRLVEGRRVTIEECHFSTDPAFINYGDNSGFQAVNLALLWGCKTIVLIGFDMQSTGGKHHFFGDHPPGIGQANQPPFSKMIRFFERASTRLPDGVRIINATPGSALQCFEIMELADALDLLDPIAPSVGATQSA